MAETSLDIIYRGVDQASGVAKSIGQRANRELEDLQQRQFRAGASARDQELHALDEHYAQVRARQQKNLEQLAKAEQTAQSGAIRAGMKHEDVTKYERQLAGVDAQRARVGDVLAQADKSEAAERFNLKKKWADEDAAGARAHADQRLADQKRLDAQLFAATHSAREKEIQDVRTRSAELRAQYAGDAEMHVKITEAENAQIRQINKQHQDETVHQMMSRRAMHAMFGGFIAAAGLRTALGIAEASVAGQEARDLGGRRDASLQDIAGANLRAVEARGNAMNGIPVAGELFKIMSDAFGNPEGLKKLGEAAEKSAGHLERLGGIAAAAARNIESGRASLYNYSPAERAAREIDAGEQARRTQRFEGMAAVTSAAGALAQAQASGVGVLQAQTALDLARSRFAGLLGLEQQEGRLQRDQADEARVADARQFWRQYGSRTDSVSRGLAGPETPEMRRAQERSELALRHQTEMDPFANLEQRRKEAADSDQWRKDWVEREYAKRLAAGEATDFGSQATLRARLNASDSFDALRAETGFISAQTDRRNITAELQESEKKAQLARQARDRADAQREAQMIGLGASPLQSAARARERMETEMAGRTEDPAVAAAKAQALKDRLRLEDEDRERRHQHTMADAAAEATGSREDMRRREMDRIRESYDEELRKFADNAEEKKRILGEIAEKQTALTARQEEDRRQEKAGVLGGALRMAGGAYADIADRLDVMEKYRKMRREFAGDSEIAGLLGPMQRAEMSELQAREGFLPHEVAARRMGGDAGRPSGFDNPTVALTTEIKQLREWLSQKFGSGGIMRVESFQ